MRGAGDPPGLIDGDEEAVALPSQLALEGATGKGLRAGGLPEPSFEDGGSYTDLLRVGSSQ